MPRKYRELEKKVAKKFREVWKKNKHLCKDYADILALFLKHVPYDDYRQVGNYHHLIRRTVVFVTNKSNFDVELAAREFAEKYHLGIPRKTSHLLHAIRVMQHLDGRKPLTEKEFKKAAKSAGITITDNTLKEIWSSVFDAKQVDEGEVVDAVMKIRKFLRKDPTHYGELMHAIYGSNLYKTLITKPEKFVATLLSYLRLAREKSWQVRTVLLVTRKLGRLPETKEEFKKTARKIGSILEDKELDEIWENILEKMERRQKQKK